MRHQDINAAKFDPTNVGQRVSLNHQTVIDGFASMCLGEHAKTGPLLYHTLVCLQHAQDDMARGAQMTKNGRPPLALKLI